MYVKHTYDLEHEKHYDEDDVELCQGQQKVGQDLPENYVELDVDVAELDGAIQQEVDVVFVELKFLAIDPLVNVDDETQPNQEHSEGNADQQVVFALPAGNAEEMVLHLAVYVGHAPQSI